MSQRKQIILFVLLALVLGYLWLRDAGGPGFGGMGGKGGEDAGKFAMSDIPRLAGEAPGQRPDEQFNRLDRDLFGFSESPEAREARLAKLAAAEEARRKAAAEKAAKKRLEDERRRKEAKEKAERDAEAARLAELERQRLAALKVDEPPVEVIPPKPPPPPFPYLYEGLIGPRDGAVAILRTKEEMKLAYAQTGQVLDEDFRIERVGQLSLTLSFTDPQFEGEVRQVPLRPDVPGGATAAPEKDRDSDRDSRSRRTSRRR